MKYVYLFIFFHSSFNCFSQISNSNLNNTFILNGQVTGRETGRIILSYQDSTNNWLSDTTWIKNGKFSFKGFIDQPTLAVLGEPKYEKGGTVNAVSLFIEPKEMSVLVEKDYKHADLQGSDTQKEFLVFLKEKNEVKLKWKSITEENEELNYSNVKDSIGKDSISKKLIQIRHKLAQRNEEMNNVKYRFIETFPDSYISAYLLVYFDTRPSIEYQRTAYEKFSNNVKNSRYGKYIKDEIQRRALVDIGAFAPDFTGSNPGGKLVQLSDLKGKFVLIDFWASWCIPCREGIPELKKYYDQYNSKGFEIVTISIVRSRYDWEKAITEEKITQFYNVLVNEEITKGYENVWRPIPSQILINRQGIIIWKKSADIERDSRSLGTVLMEILNK